MKRVALMFLSLEASQKLAQRFKGLGQRLIAFYPGLRYDVANAQIPISPEAYFVGAFFSAMIWGGIVGMFLFVVTRVRAMTGPLALLLPFIGFYGVALAFLGIHVIYPKIISKNIADKIDRGLIFAVRDMLIQTSSGIPLFTVLANIADGDYGLISQEFKRTTNQVRSGQGLSQALEDMALRNQSKYLKKTCWQLITAMRSGANLSVALKSIIKLLVDYQMALNKAYAGELNFVVLIYLLIAAVLPTIGTTMLVIFSLFNVLQITPELYAGIVFAGFGVQCVVIFYVNMRRPNLYV